MDEISQVNITSQYDHLECLSLMNINIEDEFKSSEFVFKRYHDRRIFWLKKWSEVDFSWNDLTSVNEDLKMSEDEGKVWDLSNNGIKRIKLSDYYRPHREHWGIEGQIPKHELVEYREKFSIDPYDKNGFATDHFLIEFGYLVNVNDELFHIFHLDLNQIPAQYHVSLEQRVKLFIDSRVRYSGEVLALPMGIPIGGDSRLKLVGVRLELIFNYLFTLDRKETFPSVEFIFCEIPIVLSKSVQYKKRLRFKYCLFNGVVAFENCSFYSISFYSCTFRGFLQCPICEFKTDLGFDYSVFYDSIGLGNSDIRGMLVLDDCSIFGHVLSQGLEIKGSIETSNCKFIGFDNLALECKSANDKDRASNSSKILRYERTFRQLKAVSEKDKNSNSYNKFHILEYKASLVNTYNSPSRKWYLKFYSLYEFGYSVRSSVFMTLIIIPIAFTLIYFFISYLGLNVLGECKNDFACKIIKSFSMSGRNSFLPFDIWKNERGLVFNNDVLGGISFFTVKLLGTFQFILSSISISMVYLSIKRKLGFG